MVITGGLAYIQILWEIKEKAMNDYDVTMEMLRRHNEGKIDLTDQEADQLARQAKAMGERFAVESKPLSKGAFDFADMAVFGLIPDKWRPTSQGQDIIGETGLDKASSTIAALGGLATGVGVATKGAKIGWNALKKVFAKKKADDIAANIYKGNLLPAGPPVPQLGVGRPLQIGQGSPIGLPGPGVGRMGQLGRQPYPMIPPYQGFQRGGMMPRRPMPNQRPAGTSLGLPAPPPQQNPAPIMQNPGMAPNQIQAPMPRGNLGLPTMNPNPGMAPLNRPPGRLR